MINIRTASPSDASQISRVLAASWKTAYRGIVADDYLDSLMDNHWVDFLETKVDNDSVFSMVLQDGQEIIGACILGKSEKDDEINLISFYLLPGKIGCGLGHIFYSEIEKEMVSRGFTKCVLDVLANNKRALDFYESHGFIDTNTETSATLGEKSYICKTLEKLL